MSYTNTLLQLRFVIGYLGEKSQHGWWQCDFFNPSAESFLNPLFPRTRLLAQVEGCGSAARLLHDERIGVGKVFHLFRLPEEYEQNFHEQLVVPNVDAGYKGIATSEKKALAFLEKQSDRQTINSTGPLLVGNISNLSTEGVVQKMAGAYLYGFKNGEVVLPYLKAE